MSGFSLSKLLPGSTHHRERADPISRIRHTLDGLPIRRNYNFDSDARTEVISLLYSSFFGSHALQFLTHSSVLDSIHEGKWLSELQVESRFCGAGSTENEAIIPGRPCGHIFSKGESCFRCKDCSLDDSCVMCARCFHATNDRHANHNVSFFIAQQPGGCCDCGDEEAWRSSPDCPAHPPLPPGSPTPEDEDTEPNTPPSHHDDEIHPVKHYPHRVPIPTDLLESMGRTIAIALEYALDTLDYCPDEPGVPRTEQAMRAQPSAEPPPTPSSHSANDMWSVLAWNDDKHSFDEVISVLCDATKLPRASVDALVKAIDEQGRQVVATSAEAGKLLQVAQSMAQIDLGVTIRRAYDTFREQVAACMIEWLLDLTRSRLMTDQLILREMVCRELLLPRNKPVTVHQLFGGTVTSPKRIDWLFLYHNRLWKGPRLNLKEVYAAVCSLSKQHRLVIAGHFANMYNRVVDTYLLVDREVETSIKYFALQLFTTPSVALHIVRNHGIISRLLGIITAFFTNQISDKRIRFPPAAHEQVDVESFPFKSKRFMPVFSDLRYLANNASVQYLIANNHEFINQFTQVCQLFMGINPNKRASEEHVEYETEAWISVFNVTLSLSRVIKVYGEAYARATPTQLVTAISTVMHGIMLTCSLINDRLDKTKYFPITFHSVTFGPSQTSYNIVKFTVLMGWVSFHHSLHWLLAELVKHVDILSEESLISDGFNGNLKTILKESVGEQSLLTLIDFPLRVLVMIAQIRIGLWVRNGFAIRGQLLHYRDFMLRELCYDQDIFILQTALVVLDPNLVIVTILDRFAVRGYFGSALRYKPDGYDEDAYAFPMIEELLYILITLVSEVTNATKMPLDVAVRREIVHALALGACSFTDLVKRVSERMADDVCFERILAEVAHFKSPEGITDTGLFELKDAYFDEVDPFFYHYTRNRREEVEVTLKNRLRRLNGANPDPVIVPRPGIIRSGPFVQLKEVFTCEAFMQVLFYAFWDVLVFQDQKKTAPSAAEAIYDQTIHLVMLAVLQSPGRFTELAVSVIYEDGETLLDLLCEIEHHTIFKSYTSRLRWILEILEQHSPASVKEKRRQPDVTPVQTEGDVKKKAAKARQDAIMAQMKAQQASFASNFDGEEEEDMMEVVSEEVSFGTCIVCQEDLNHVKHFGSLGFIQPSRFIRMHDDQSTAHLQTVMQVATSLDRSQKLDAGSFPPFDYSSTDKRAQSFQGFSPHHTRFGLNASVCGHMMHLECFQVYSVSIRQRHRSQATRNHPESMSRKEFICPLCKSLGNVILPAAPVPTVWNEQPRKQFFPDFVRSAGISILRSKPDPALEALQFPNGTGEFVFWSAQDPGYMSVFLNNMRLDGPDREMNLELGKMVDSVVHVSRNLSSQTRHLRDRPEPEPGERGAGIYLPEELIGYTISVIEIGLRGTGSSDTLISHQITDQHKSMIVGLVDCLSRLGAMHFAGRPDEGREAISQAIVKRLLPEWSRSSPTSFSYPLLLRDPFTLLIETAASTPAILRHVIIFAYYACLARTVVGLVYNFSKIRGVTIPAPSSRRQHTDVFGDIWMFFMSVVRHSPVFEHTATLIFENLGEARMERLLYAFTLPFLRRTAILMSAMSSSDLASHNTIPHEASEYTRLLTLLRIPPLSDLPNQEILQNTLSGWCAHYGHSHAASQLNCTVSLDYPAVYRLAQLPIALDNLFGGRDKAMQCARCETVPVDAAICLLCGTTVCMQSHCCKEKEGDFRERGECNMHTRECGGAIGLYFLVKRCTLLYLYANNGSFAPSPYLDVHGEADISMRRGRRQYLHHARWEDIRKIWMAHGIPTYIARKLESALDNGGWETL